SQVYNGVMAGCGGSVVLASNGTLCTPGCHVCSSTEYVANNGGLEPNLHYWLSDLLFSYGSSPGNRLGSPTNPGGATCGAGSSMLVCDGVTTRNPNTDGEGNNCSWSHCGYGTDGLGSLNGGVDEFLGGCAVANSGGTDITAGALCCCP